jgi:hypothetical protein
MDKKTINLGKYRGNNSSYFTGRPQGEEVRKVLNLDSIDSSDTIVEFEIPIGTTSFNPSFYLGLLFKSFELLGQEAFEQKYEFNILDEKDEIRQVIKSNLEDAKRNALNSLKNRGGFKKFI